MKSPKLKGMVLSDIHLFHAKTRTYDICYGLFKVLADNARLREFDIIWISGDLFDHAVYMPNKDISLVTTWISHLLEMCYKYDIVLRILEGTPGHDHKQSRMVEDINNARENKADVKHVIPLSIEYIEKFGINVLYVPDEWGPTCDSTYKEVQELLVKHNLEQVDFSIMHGCFTYQFPSNLVGKVDVHNENSYLSITKYLIFIGHYHKPSSFERIYVPGSFDRLAHGEEEPKGHLEFVVYQDGNYQVDFIENKHATLFKTIDCTGFTAKKTLDAVDKVVTIKDKPMHVRIIANTDDPVYKSVADLKQLYPNVHFKVQASKKIEDKQVSKTEDITRPKALTLEAIEKILADRLNEKYPDVATQAMNLFRNISDEYK